MKFETILVRSQDSIALVTLNRPDKLNAMSMVLKEELVRALRELDADKVTRVVVITGAGQKAFTAGADIHEFQGRTPMDQWRMYEHGTLYDAVDRMSKPILAMINGYCFGGGLELAMACDIRIASSRATLGQTELNIGIIPGGGGSQRLSRLVGLGNAMKLTLTGDRIDAAEALRIGLVDEVVPNARLEPRTFELGGKIAAHSALAVRLAKAAIRASTRLPHDQCDDLPQLHVRPARRAAFRAGPTSHGEGLRRLSELHDPGSHRGSGRHRPRHRLQVEEVSGHLRRHRLPRRGGADSVHHLHDHLRHSRRGDERREFEYPGVLRLDPRYRERGVGTADRLVPADGQRPRVRMGVLRSLARASHEKTRPDEDRSDVEARVVARSCAATAASAAR